MTGRLAGKTALVTGAAAGPTARPLPMDVSDEESVMSGFAALAADGWVPDVVVVNAGVQCTRCGTRPRACSWRGNAHQVVQEHLGHSSYAITADIYSHVTPAQQT